jgi:hypothetical protein
MGTSWGMAGGSLADDRSPQGAGRLSTSYWCV